MKLLGEANKILGMEITRTRSKREIKLSQCSYIGKILHSFGMDKCKVMTIPIASHFKLPKRDSPSCVEEE